MRETRTFVDIDASAAVVWGILTDFNAYGRWNPLIRGVLGRASEGRMIEIQLRAGSGSASARPTIVRLREFREMQWLESWRLPGLYSSDRRFRIELRSSGVRFHYSERCGGVLALLRGRRAEPARAAAAMNTALKQRAEGTAAPRTAAPR